MLHLGAQLLADNPRRPPASPPATAELLAEPEEGGPRQWVYTTDDSVSKLKDHFETAVDESWSPLDYWAESASGTVGRRWRRPFTDGVEEELRIRMRRENGFTEIRMALSMHIIREP